MTWAALRAWASGSVRRAGAARAEFGRAATPRAAHDGGQQPGAVAVRPSRVGLLAQSGDGGDSPASVGGAAGRTARAGAGGGCAGAAARAHSLRGLARWDRVQARPPRRGGVEASERPAEVSTVASRTGRGARRDVRPGAERAPKDRWRPAPTDSPAAPATDRSPPLRARIEGCPGLPRRSPSLRPGKDEDTEESLPRGGGVTGVVQPGR